MNDHQGGDDSMQSPSVSVDDLTDNQFFKTLVEGVSVGVGAVGSDGTFVYVNEQYASMVDRDPESLIGAGIETVNPAVDPDRFDQYWQSFSEGETKEYETVHECADGETFPVRTRSTRITIGGEPYNVGTVQDITELQNHREQTDVLRRVLRHDLRNRLNVVSGYIDMIEAELNAGDGLRDHFEEIKEEIDHLLATSENSRRLEDLLQTKTESQEAKTEVLRLDRLLEDAIAKTEEKFPAATIDYSDPGRLPIRAAGYMGQALAHVLANGIIHNDADNPRVEVSAQARNGNVVIRVADNGPGISDDQKDLVFGREERNQLHHGKGFGLYFVENVVTESGGEIWIEDNDPRGAVVNIALQRAE